MNDLVKDLQKQTVDSSLITLFELELDPDITENSYVYFHEGLEADNTTIQFRSSTANTVTGKYDAIEYDAIPIQATGFSLSSSGTSPRPTLTIANILSTFSDSLDGLKNQDMLGKKLIRRRTLYKYCVGQSGDAGNESPPIEYPSETWIIDRIAGESKATVGFELASPFDIQGTKLPKRSIIGNACPWIYQAGDEDKAESNQTGGCTWKRSSKIVNASGTTFTNFVNSDDEPIVLKSVADAAPTYSSGSVTQNYIYKTAITSIKQILAGGTVASTSGVTVYDYWQAIKASSAPGTPSDSNRNFRRVRAYRNFSKNDTYYAFTDTNYNDYVAYTIGEAEDDRRTLESFPRLWQVKTETLEGNAHKPVGKAYPHFGHYWKKGDQCGKTLNSCMQRYQFVDASIDSSNNKGPSVLRDESKTLFFGGFPASKRLGR